MKTVMAILMAFLIPVIVVPSVMATDANWNALRQEWNAQQKQGEQEKAKLKAVESDATKAASSVPVATPQPGVRSGEPAAK